MGHVLVTLLLTRTIDFRTILVHRAFGALQIMRSLADFGIFERVAAPGAVHHNRF